MTRPTWLDDSSSQVVARAMTHTGPDGVWRLDLIPYTSYESQLAGCAFYHITEDVTPPILTVIRVPEAGEDEELWMRDLVFDPDPCRNRSGFIPINTLARLHDVDASSLAAAKPGDFLILLPSGKWGAARGPMPLTVSWAPDADEMLTIHINVVGFGGAGARVGFGDGSDEVTVYSYEAITHTYSEPGTYIVTATDVAWPAFTGTTKVGVKDHPPHIYAFHDSDDDWRVLLWVDETADDTRYAIDWGDGSPVIETFGQNIGRVPPRPRVPHQYTAIGIYDVIVTDLATKRQTTQVAYVGEIGVLITYDSASRVRTDWFWMAAGARWEFEAENSPPDTGIVPASGVVSRPARHDLPPGDYGFEVREVVGEALRRTTHRRAIVPTPWDWRMDVEIIWRAHDDPLGIQTITVTPHGARSRCTVEWGDGSPSELVDPGVSIAHRYTLPAPQQGWRLRLTETNIEEPRVWSRVLGEPRHVGTPMLSSRTRGAVDLEVHGIDHDYNDDWYSIAWEEASTPDPVGAVGRWYSASHVYTSAGRKRIMLDSPGMVEPITREIDVIFYPSPTVTAVEERDAEGKIVDPTRMTARVSVDNTASGGACTVRLGDGSAPQPCAEVDSFTHQYQAAGTYYAIVSSNADPTARGRTAVTVPFGAARTLFYDLSGDLGGFLVTCALTAHDPAKSVQVQWESGGPWSPVPPNGQVSYVYPAIEASYDVTVAYTDDSERWTTPIDLPWEESGVIHG